MEEALDEGPALIPETVADRLRSARHRAGIDLSDIATKTRIPQRHLEAIEAGNYAALPAPTYVFGFVKAYARAVGEDEVVLARDLRSELGHIDQEQEYVGYDTDDPARVPPRWLAWGGLVAAALLLFGFFAVRSGWFASSDSPAVASAPATVEPGLSVDGGGNTVTPAAPATGQVVLTMDEDVWLRIYDKNDKVITEGVRKKGEAIAIAPDIDTPMIRTQLPHKISITIGGKPVPKLAEAEKFMKDAGISAKALSARVAPTVPANTAATAATKTQ